MPRLNRASSGSQSSVAAGFSIRSRGIVVEGSLRDGIYQMRPNRIKKKKGFPEFLKNKTLAVFDTETTGLNPNFGDRVCEVAVLRWKNGEIVKTFQTLVEPLRPVSPGAFAVNEITPATLVFARTARAAVILLPIALTQVNLRAVLRRWRWVVAFAAVEIAGPWVPLGSAEQHISSSLAGLLVAGVPLVGSAIALATGGPDRLGRTGLLGLLVGLVGVVAIVGGDFDAPDATALLSIGVMALSLALCAVVYAPIAAAQWPSVVPSADVLASVAILAVVCTAAAFLLFAALIVEVGPIRATVITYVNPAVAATLGVLFLNETFSVAMAIGFGLVIFDSTLAARPSLAA